MGKLRFFRGKLLRFFVICFFAATNFPLPFSSVFPPPPPGGLEKKNFSFSARFLFTPALSQWEAWKNSYWLCFVEKKNNKIPQKTENCEEKVFYGIFSGHPINFTYPHGGIVGWNELNNTVNLFLFGATNALNARNNTERFRKTLVAMN